MEFAKKREKKRLQLNITSLIDVVFILLIFFMVTSTFLEQPGIQLDLPSAKAHVPQPARENTLIITKSQKMYLNDVPVTFGSLPSFIKTFVSEGAKTLVIKADKNVSYGVVVEAMDIMKTYGVKKIIIATQPKD